MLQARVNREQAKISALTAQFHVNATGQSAPLLEQQEFPLLQQAAHFFGVGTVLVDEEALRPEGGIHQAGNILCFFGLGRAGLHELDWQGRGHPLLQF
jgi:hypothetical protein